MASARNMASADLQELPFTPLHAPIMAMAPGMHRYVPMIEEGGGATGPRWDGDTSLSTPSWPCTGMYP